MKRLHDVLRILYSALINRKRVLVQHDNVPAHTSSVLRGQLTVLLRPPYRLHLTPSDFHLFPAMAHFLQRRDLSSLKETEVAVRDFLASKPSESYYKELLALTER